MESLVIFALFTLLFHIVFTGAAIYRKDLISAVVGFAVSAGVGWGFFLTERSSDFILDGIGHLYLIPVITYILVRKICK